MSNMDLYNNNSIFGARSALSNQPAGSEAGGVLAGQPAVAEADRLGADLVKAEVAMAWQGLGSCQF